MIFSDNAEAGDANWNYAAPWMRSNGTQPFTHNYYLQWRNVSKSGGYDESLGDARWRFGPANTGLLVWYNNNFYNDNEIFNYLTDFPGYGPKGRMLVVDSHPEPYRYPDLVAQGYNNEGGNLASSWPDARRAVQLERVCPLQLHRSLRLGECVDSEALQLSWPAGDEHLP